MHRYVGWMDAKDASNTYAEAYKRTVVTVTWTDQAGVHNIHQSSIVYPGGEGKYSGPQGAGLTTTTPTTILTTPGQPTLNPITVPGPGALALSWTAPSSGAAVTSYSIEYSTDPSFPAGNFTSIGNPATNTLAPSILTYTLTGLADSTLYYVEIIAYSGTNPGTPSAPQSATTQNPPATCTLGPLSVAGATTKSTSGTFLTKAGRMTENLTLSWSTSGTGTTSDGQHQCTNTFQVVAANSGGGADPNSPYTISATTPGNYSGTITSKNQRGWATGVHTFTIWDVTTGSSTFVVKTFKICARGSADVLTQRLLPANDEDRDDAAEAGFTLIELIVSMSILMLVLGMFFGTLASLTKSEDRAQRLVSNEQAVRFELDQLSREIRAANPIVGVAEPHGLLQPDRDGARPDGRHAASRALDLRHRPELAEVRAAAARADVEHVEYRDGAVIVVVPHAHPQRRDGNSALHLLRLPQPRHGRRRVQQLRHPELRDSRAHLDVVGLEPRTIAVHRDARRGTPQSPARRCRMQRRELSRERIGTSAAA